MRLVLRAIFWPSSASKLSMTMVALALFSTQALGASHSETSKPLSDFARAVQAVKDKNYQLALNLFEREAEKSEFEAMYNLAILLKSGKGRPQNYTQALYWAYLSQLGGVELAKDLVKDLEDLLNEAQKKPVLERVETYLIEQINKGMFDAIPYYADYLITVREEPDYERAYQWYAIATALGQQDMIPKRDEMESEIEKEKIVDLQAQSTALFNQLMRGEKIVVREKSDEN